MAEQQPAGRTFDFAVVAHQFELPALQGLDITQIQRTKHQLESQFKAGPFTFCCRAQPLLSTRLCIIVSQVGRPVEASAGQKEQPLASACCQPWFQYNGKQLHTTPQRRDLAPPDERLEDVHMQIRTPTEVLIAAQAAGSSVTVGVRMAIALPLACASHKASEHMGIGDAARISTWAPPNPKYQDFWGDASFADCSVRAAHGVVFPCHRVVLSAASPVFRAAFAGGMREAAQQEVVVQDAHADVLRLLLQHAYGQPHLDVPLPLLLPLLRLADQYGMEELKDGVKFCLMAANLSGAALAVLAPQARILGFEALAAFFAQRIVSSDELCEAAESSGLLSSWTLQDVQLLVASSAKNVRQVVASGSMFLGFKAALKWVQQRAAADAAAVADKGGALSAALDGPAAAAGAASAAAAVAAAVAAAAAAAAEEEGISRMPHKRQRTGDAPMATTPPAFSTHAAWAVLLPMVRFQRFSEAQLTAARALPGADRVPGLSGALLEAWEDNVAHRDVQERCAIEEAVQRAEEAWHAELEEGAFAVP